MSAPAHSRMPMPPCRASIAGWAFMIALAFWWTARHWVVRALAVIEAVGMIAAVVFTANHYFFDGALGIAVVLLALAITWAIQSLGREAPPRQTGRPMPPLAQVPALFALIYCTMIRW